MVHYEIDAARRRVDVRLEGTTSGAQLIAAFQRIMEDPALDTAYAALIDLRGLEAMPSVGELRELAAAMRARAVVSGARRAIVSGSALFLGLSNLFTWLTADAVTVYRAFRDIGEAEEWLAGGPSSEGAKGDPG